MDSSRVNGGDDGEMGCMIILLLIGIVVGTIVGVFMKTEVIETFEPIEPTIKLTVKDNVIDTLYIYKIK